MSRANFGHTRERQVRKRLEEDGYWVCRAAGSLGDADLVASRAGETPLMIEVKATAAGPFHSFGPEKRDALLAAAEKAGFKPALAYWPKRGQLTYVHKEAWPNGNSR